MSYVAVLITCIFLTIIVSCIMHLILIRKLVNMIIECFEQQDKFDSKICGHINKIYDIIIFNGLRRPVKKGIEKDENSSPQ